MSRFEFIFVPISIVAGLALTQLLGGLTRSLRGSKRKIDIAHVAFSLAAIVLLFSVWWETFRWENHEIWTFAEFSLLGVYISMFYVFAVILYPSRSLAVPRFEEVRTRFYSASILYSSLELMVIYVRDGLFSPWYYLPIVVHLMVLAAIGIFLRNNKFDQFFAGWLLLLTLSWPFFVTLRG